MKCLSVRAEGETLHNGNKLMIEQPLPLVTVVITCYNQARFLGEAIESALGQTYPRRCEVIVVDDGSTDDTTQAVARYRDARYIHQSNQGVAAARNTGLRESTGEYLIIMDGDDRLLPDTVAIGLEEFKEHPECAFIVGQHSFIASDGTAHSDWGKDPLVESEHYIALLHNNFIRMPAMVMYRRAAFNAVGEFSLFADHSCDYDLYLRIARRFPVHYHDKVVAEYRVHDANTSHKSAVMLRSTMSVYRKQWKFVKGNKQLEEAYKRGAKIWQNRYGEELITKLRADVRKAGRDGWRQLLAEALTLLRYSPQVFAKHAKQKLLVTVLGVKH